MNKKSHYLLIGILSLVLLGKANSAYSWISSNTLYYKVAYCVNETGKGTVYAKGPQVSNNSNSEVILQNMNSEDPTDVTIIAPNSTATLYGTWNTVNAEVGDNTLIINPAVRIDTLVVKRGNVLVKSAYVSDCIENVVNDPANYTEAPQNESGLWTVEALVNEVGDLTTFKKVASTPSIVKFTNN